MHASWHLKCHPRYSHGQRDKQVPLRCKYCAKKTTQYCPKCSKYEIVALCSGMDDRQCFAEYHYLKQQGAP
jgi:primosomal protein N'